MHKKINKFNFFFAKDSRSSADYIYFLKEIKSVF